MGVQDTRRSGGRRRQECEVRRVGDSSWRRFESWADAGRAFNVQPKRPRKSPCDDPVAHLGRASTTRHGGWPTTTMTTHRRRTPPPPVDNNNAALSSLELEVRSRSPANAMRRDERPRCRCVAGRLDRVTRAKSGDIRPPEHRRGSSPPTEPRSRRRAVRPRGARSRPCWRPTTRPPRQRRPRPHRWPGGRRRRHAGVKRGAASVANVARRGARAPPGERRAAGRGAAAPRVVGPRGGRTTTDGRRRHRAPRGCRARPERRPAARDEGRATRRTT